LIAVVRACAAVALCLLLAVSSAAAAQQVPDRALAPAELADPADPEWIPETDLQPQAGSPYAAACSDCCDCDTWTWQCLPSGLIYKAYLAGPKESRFSSVLLDESDHGTLWDITLGGRAGMLRYGSRRMVRPEGWQLDIEGAAILRLDVEHEHDLRSADFRFGVPLTYGEGPYQTKIGYYHLSSHLGDEYMLANPNFVRYNYVRDAVVWGHSVYLTDELRIYGELDWALHHDGGAEPLHLQFGADYAPAIPTGKRGAPFAAVNVYLQEEVDFGGKITAQAGWAWRGTYTGHLFRIGVHVLNGKSPQFEFYNQSEQQVGFGMWYDY
jgi:hypothetical protein